MNETLNRDVTPRVLLGKSPFDANETVVFLHGFNSVEQCDFYTVEELDDIISSINEAREVLLKERYHNDTEEKINNEPKG